VVPSLERRRQFGVSAILASFRQLSARPIRSALTISGIAIGIIALVVVGSLAEQLHRIVAHSTALNRGAIFAIARGSDLADGSARSRVDRAIGQIRAMRGVRAVVPEVIVPYRFSGSSDRFGPPSLIFGIPAAGRALAGDALSIASGRDLQPTDVRAAVVGSDFVAAENAPVGATISLYGNSYHVVGTIAKSFTIFDAAVIVPYASSQALLRQLVPPTIARLPATPASALMVLVDRRTDTALVARRIRFLTGLEARDPRSTAANVESTTRLFDAIIFGAALVALIVGAISIVNTMTIAVTERTREIGIRKAIGAGDRDILTEFVAEAIAIGALGGAVGIVVGLGIVAVIDSHNAARGDVELFVVTPRLALGAFAFSVFLSALAGLVPAFRAARLAPTEALRRVV
jgi:putative ABC transport system permease protein